MDDETGLHRHDAFDANDRERWAYQEAKLQAASRDITRSSPSAIIGSANTKKRKVPAPSASAREAPAISRHGSATNFDQRDYFQPYDDCDRLPLSTDRNMPKREISSIKGATDNDPEGWREAMKSLLTSLIIAADPESSIQEENSSSTLDRLAFARGKICAQIEMHTRLKLGNFHKVLRRLRKRFILFRHHPCLLPYIDE